MHLGEEMSLFLMPEGFIAVEMNSSYLVNAIILYYHFAIVQPIHVTLRV